MQCCELSKDTVLVLNIKQFYTCVETVDLFAGITSLLIYSVLQCVSVQSGVNGYRYACKFPNFVYRKLTASAFIFWIITMYLCTTELNPLNPELNPICYLLALLGAHHFLHVSRIRVKLLTFRRLMSYMYGAPILDVSRSHTTMQHSR